MSIIVPPYGKTPNDVLLVGEAPGREESLRLRPFIGKAGSEQRWYLSPYSINPDSFRQCNVVWEYIEGNPDPSNTLLDKWRPTLISEVRSCRPKLIIAVGRFAARAFLGPDLEMEACHGIPHRPGAFQSSIYNRFREAGLQDTIILPIYHPALGFYDNDARALIAWDYSQVAECINKIKSRTTIYIRRDEYEGNEQYLDANGVELSRKLDACEPDSYIAVDTEGTIPDRWSMQASLLPGTGGCLRCSQPDFFIGAQSLEKASRRGCTIVMHNAMYDLPMCLAMGANLYHPDVKIWDTMYAAYLLRLEPQGLKPLLWRWCGMRQSSYQETVGNAGRTLQLDYLSRAYSLSQDWPNPEPQSIEEHDGAVRTYKPQPIQTRISKILVDVAEDKRDKDDNPVDILDRWNQIDNRLRKPVEDVLGPIPIGTLDNISLDKAIHYSCRDSDGTLRLYYQLHSQLESRGLLPLMDVGMSVLPVFSEMQSTGMPASRSHFLNLHRDMLNDMRKYQRRLSKLYYSGKPFNPGSSKQVASLLRRRGLKSEKKTESGEMSTSKGSIEHLRYTDPAISDVFEWRERQHIRDSFCAPILDKSPDTEEDIYTVYTQIKTTRVHTRRLATSNPNLLAIPAQTEIGNRVRLCYRCDPNTDEIFGAWDLSQIEARFMAHESQDPLLIKFFQNGQDIHAETAASIFDIPLELVTKEQRRAAKTINFGLLYGLQADGLETQLRMLGILYSKSRCEELRIKVLGLYTKVREYIEATTIETCGEDEVSKYTVGNDDRCRECQQLRTRRHKLSCTLRKGTGLVRDCWGMVRYLPGAWHPHPSIKMEAGRIAVSHKIQGGAQGMIQNSIAYLRPIIYQMQCQGLDVKWCLQIHDEIILRFSEWLWESLNDLVLYALTKECGIQLRVPVLAEGHKAKSWGELK